MDVFTITYYKEICRHIFTLNQWAIKAKQVDNKNNNLTYNLIQRSMIIQLTPGF